MSEHVSTNELVHSQEGGKTDVGTTTSVGPNTPQKPQNTKPDYSTKIRIFYLYFINSSYQTHQDESYNGMKVENSLQKAVCGSWGWSQVFYTRQTCQRLELKSTDLDPLLEMFSSSKLQSRPQRTSCWSAGISKDEWTTRLCWTNESSGLKSNKSLILICLWQKLMWIQDLKTPKLLNADEYPFDHLKLSQLRFLTVLDLRTEAWNHKPPTLRRNRKLGIIFSSNCSFIFCFKSVKLVF